MKPNSQSVVVLGFAWSLALLLFLLLLGRLTNGVDAAYE